jgi:hypothetical protein
METKTSYILETLTKNYVDVVILNYIELNEKTIPVNQDRYSFSNSSMGRERMLTVLPEEYINFVVKRVQGPTKTIEYLPENIKSLKPRSSVK